MSDSSLQKWFHNIADSVNWHSLTTAVAGCSFNVKNIEYSVTRNVGFMYKSCESHNQLKDRVAKCLRDYRSLKDSSKERSGQYSFNIL